MLTPPPPSVSRAMGAYEESLSEVQHAYRRLAGAKGAARDAAQREYERALERARALGEGVRRAQSAS